MYHCGEENTHFLSLNLDVPSNSVRWNIYFDIEYLCAIIRSLSTPFMKKVLESFLNNKKKKKKNEYNFIYLWEVKNKESEKSWIDSCCYLDYCYSIILTLLLCKMITAFEARRKIKET